MDSSTHLEHAIVLETEALEVRPPGHGDRAMSLYNLAIDLRTRYNNLADLADLEHAIELGTEALELRPPGHGDRAFSLINLGVDLNNRYNELGDLADLEHAIELDTEALELRPPGHGEHVLSLTNLGIYLRARYNKLGDLADIERAIELDTEALELRPPGHGDRAISLFNLAIDLRSRYNKLGNLADVERAIELDADALKLRPPGHGDRASSLTNLGVDFNNRFNKTGDLADLERAIKLDTEALELRPPGHRDRASSLINLGVDLNNRYNKLGDLADLEHAIELDAEALELRPPGHGDRAPSLNNLGAVLLSRFNRLGDLTDLERAIELDAEALELRPLGHVDRWGSLTGLAWDLYTRYQKMGNLIDLEHIIELQLDAIDILPPDNKVPRGVCLCNLGQFLVIRYRRTEKLTDLQRAIESLTDALEFCPPNGEFERSLHCECLAGLALCYYARYDKMGDPGDLEDTIQLCTKALGYCSTIYDSSLHGGLLADLAHALNARYKLMCDSRDLNRAIQLCQEGFVLVMRESQEDRDEVFGLLKEGTKDLASSWDAFLQCALQWIQYSREAEDEENITNAYDSVINILQNHLPIWPTMQLQYDALHQHVLTGVLNSPMDAAAHAIGMEKVERAVELLDAGRSVLWSEQRRFRQPVLLSELLDKKLAKEFEETCRELRHISTMETSGDNSFKLDPGKLKSKTRLQASGDKSASGTAFSLAPNFDVVLRRKRKLLELYNSQLRRIRETKGLERFLERPSFEELRRAAEPGPVIIVNCSQYGSHAIIVFADRSPIPIQLNGDFRDNARRLANKLQKGITKENPANYFERDLRAAANFLWEDVVEDVVEKLTDAGVTPGEGRRIWWCPTTFLTTLPFHAAGKGKKFLIDLYISSYAPTLESLIDARNSPESDLSVNGDHPSILVVAQTQEESNLPSAGDEKDVILNLQSHNIARVECMDQEKATKDAVLERLQSHSWAHFICHAKLSETGSPFDSALMVHDGDLSFNHLIKSHLPDAKFAFLAACHTADQTKSALPDEALNLASAMYFSGFRSVVGTMWKMRDEDGPEVAEKFYEEMLRDESGPDEGASPKPRHTRAAEALWKVTRELKGRKVLNEEGKKVPIGIHRWANYIHIGA